MTTHKKTFPWTAIGIAVSVLVLVSGIISTFAVNGEKVRQLELQQEKTSAELSLNSIEHKKIIETLGNVDKSLTRIETKLEFVPIPTRYSNYQSRRKEQ